MPTPLQQAPLMIYVSARSFRVVAKYPPYVDECTVNLISGVHQLPPMTSTGRLQFKRLLDDIYWLCQDRPYIGGS